MSYLISPGTRSNGSLQKPSANARVNWAHPLSKNLQIQTFFNDPGTVVSNMVRGQPDGVAANATYSIDSKFGKVINPGSGFSNKIDYLSSAAKLATATTTTPWTMEFWVKHSSLTSGTNYSDYFDINSDSIEIWNDFTFGKPHLSDLSGFDLTSSVALSINTWYQLVFVFTGSQGQIYTNGVLTGSAAWAATGLNATAPSNWCLFNDNSGGGPHLGTASSFRYWNGRALNAAEIQQLYYQPFINVLPNESRYLTAPATVAANSYFGIKRSRSTNGSLDKPNTNATVNWAHSISKGLVGCWLFNEGQGKTLRNLALPGKGDATIPSSSMASLGAITKSGFGITSGASGSSSFAPQTSDISQLDCPNGYTLETWIKLNATGSAATIAGKGAGDVYNIWYDGTHFRTDLQHGNGIYDSCTSNTAPSAGVWYHLVGTWDGTVSNAAIKIYVNGQFEASVPCNAAPNSASGTGFFMAGGPDNANDPTPNASLDFVRLWNRPLSQTEISQIYAQPFINIQPSATRYLVAPVATAGSGGTNYLQSLVASSSSGPAFVRGIGKFLSKSTATGPTRKAGVAKTLTKTVTETPKVTKNPAKTLVATALAMVKTLTTALVFIRALVVTIATGASSIRSVAKYLSPAVIWSITANRVISTTKSTSQGSSGSFTKSMSKALSITQSLLAGLTAGLGYFKTLASTLSGSPTLTNGVGKTFSTSVTSSVSALKSVGKQAQAILSTSLARTASVAKSILASTSVQASRTSDVEMSRSTSTSVTSSLQNSIGHTLVASASTIATKTISVGKGIIAGLVTLASLTAQFGSGAVNYAKELTASLAANSSVQNGLAVARIATLVVSATYVLNALKAFIGSLTGNAALRSAVEKLQAVSVTSTVTKTLSSSKKILISLGMTSTSGRNVVKNLLGSLTSTVSLIRGQGFFKTLSIGLTTASTLTEALVYSRIIETSLSFSYSLTKAIAKRIQSSLTLFSYIYKYINIYRNTSIRLSSTILKGFFYNLFSSLSSSVSLIKGQGIRLILNATLSLTSSGSREIAKLLPVGLLTNTKAAFAIGKILKATLSPIASIVRAIISAIIKLPAYSTLELQNDYESVLSEYLPAAMTLEEDSAAETEFTEIG